MLVKSAFERLSPERKKKLIDTAMDLYFESLLMRSPYGSCGQTWN